MGSVKYTVLVESVPAAQHMELDIAVMLVEAMFSKWFDQACASELNITIRSEPVRPFGKNDG